MKFMIPAIAFLAVSSLLFTGCSATARQNGTYIEEQGYSYRYIAFITDDAVQKISAVLPPAKTQIRLSSPAELDPRDYFGKSLMEGLRQHGFSATTGTPDADSSFLPLTYALSNLDKNPGKFHVVINIGSMQFTRLYSANAGKIVPASVWSVRR